MLLALGVETDFRCKECLVHLEINNPAAMKGLILWMLRFGLMLTMGKYKSNNSLKVVQNKLKLLAGSWWLITSFHESCDSPILKRWQFSGVKEWVVLDVDLCLIGLVAGS
jgi:hypothetical protein